MKLFLLSSLLFFMGCDVIEGTLQTVDNKPLEIKDFKGNTKFIQPGFISVRVNDNGTIVINDQNKKEKINLNVSDDFNFNVLASESGQPFDLVSHKKSFDLGETFRGHYFNQCDCQMIKDRRGNYYQYCYGEYQYDLYTINTKIIVDMLFLVPNTNTLKASIKSESVYHQDITRNQTMCFRRRFNDDYRYPNNSNYYR